MINGKKKMDEVLDLVKEDLLGVQTGRAKPDMVESIKVEAYEGSWLTIRELANISASDSRTLVIKPWDQSTLKNMVKGIQESDLQVSPVVDGDLIRIIIPALNQERRQELVKVVKQKIEAGKAMLRQVRLEVKKEIDKQKDQTGVSEDDVHNLLEELQKLINEYNQKLDAQEKQKEQELMSL